MLKLKKGKVKRRELIFFAIFLVIYAAVLMDKFIQKSYANLKILEKEIAVNERKLFYLKNILNKGGEINLDYDRLALRKTTVNDSDSLMQEINRVARRHNVNIINIKPNLIKDEQKYKAFSVKIESQDDVATLANFLYALTEEQKDIGVERLHIKAQGKEELPRISLVLNAAVFKD